jgi:hypothetical protein
LASDPKKVTMGKRGRVMLLVVCLHSLPTISPRSLASLRGGGGGAGSEASMPRIPADAVGLLSSSGLQLRAVNWQAAQDDPRPAADAAEPRMSDGEGVAAHDVAGEDDDDSFASLASSDEDGAQRAGESDTVTPAQEQLWEACKRGDDAAIYRLVRTEGADVNARDPSFGLWTACHYAAHAGRSRVVEALWRLGANIDAGNGAGSTPLAIAAAEGHVSLVQKLVAKGANVTATSEYGSTALHQAALNGCTRTCEALLTLGAQVDG